MSLIKCPECGKKFSDKVDDCPKCSCPVSEIKKINTTKKKDKPNKKEKIKKSKNIKKQNIIESIKTDKRKRTILLYIVLIIVLVIISFLCLTVFNDNWKKANINYENAYKIAYKKNSDLEELITKSEKLVYSDNIALDEELRPTLETSISESKAALKELPKKSLFTKKNNENTKKLNSIDYEEVYKKLNQDYTNLDKSIRKYKLVYQPKEAYVIECLKQVKHVNNIAAVTEDNDPNGKLNKPGGYTATVYYSDDRIKLDKSIYGKTVIDQGTDGGGAIEVYSTVEDATKRRDYLAAFDGGVLSNGSHTVIGTILIRTSDELTASQQKEMETLIIEVLTKLEEEKVEKEEPQKEASTDKDKVESTKK